MSLSSVSLPVSPTPPQGSLGVQRGDTVTPLLLCVPTVAGDSGNGSVTHPAPGPGFSQHLLSQGGNGETRFRVKTNISTVQSKSPFNTSPDTGGEAPDSFFLLSTFRLPPAAQRSHGAENETLPPEQTLCAQPRGTERSDTSDSTGGNLSQPQAAEPPPQGPSLAGLGAPGTPQHHLTDVRTTEAGEQSPSCCFLDPDHGPSTPCPFLGAPPGHFRGVQLVSASLCSQPADRSLTFPKPHQPRQSWARRKRPGETRPLHTRTCELAAGPALIT